MDDAHGDGDGDGVDDPTRRTADELVDLRRDHAALARSERWLRSLLGSVSDAISVLDRDGTLVFSTETGARFLGYSAEEWRTTDIRSLIHPDDHDRARAAFARSLVSPGVEISAEARVRAADGRWVDLAATGVNRLDDPEVRGIVITTSDITDLRRAQRLASSQAAVLELIARGAPLSDVFDRCVALVEENGVGGRSSSIYLLDDDRLEMRAGRAPTELNDFMRDPPHDPPRSLCDAAFATGAPTYLPDLDVGDEMPELRQVARDVGLRAGWSQPIIATGTDEVIGTLSTVYDAPHARRPRAAGR